MSTKNFKKLSNDGMAKLVFSHKNISIIFLERILGRKLDKSFSIVNKVNNEEIFPEDVIEFIKQELQNKNVHVKGKTLDLLIKTEYEILDLEINNRFNDEIKRRNYAYMCSIYANYLNHRDLYLDMPKLTQINICTSIDEDYLFDNYNVRGKMYNEELVDNINFLVFNIAKYKEILYTKDVNEIKKYAHLIMFECNKEELKILSRYDEFVKEVADLITEYNNDKNIFSFLTDEESKQKLFKSEIAGAEMRAEKRGIERGIEQNKLETAKTLLKNKIPFNIIEETTGLNQEYLQTLTM